MKTKKKEIEQIFIKVLKIKNPENANINNCKSWDSLNHVKLIIALQSKLKVKINPDEALKLNSFKKIFSYLKKTT